MQIEVFQRDQESRVDPDASPMLRSKFGDKCDDALYEAVDALPRQMR